MKKDAQQPLTMQVVNQWPVENASRGTLCAIFDALCSVCILWYGIGLSEECIELCL